MACTAFIHTGIDLVVRVLVVLCELPSGFGEEVTLEGSKGRTPFSAVLPGLVVLVVVVTSWHCCSKRICRDPAHGLHVLVEALRLRVVGEVVSRGSTWRSHLSEFASVLPPTRNTYTTTEQSSLTKQCSALLSQPVNTQLAAEWTRAVRKLTPPRCPAGMAQTRHSTNRATRSSPP